MGEVTAAIFRDGEVIDRPALDASMPHYGESAVIWIEALDPVDSDFAGLQERFKLHSLAVKDSMSQAHVPKVDVYEDQIFVVLKIASLESDEIKYADIDAFVSRQHIITVRHGRNAAYTDVQEKLRSGSRLRPDFILHAIMDVVVNSYLPVVQMVEDEVLSMEQHLLDSFLDRDEVNRLFRLRREAIHLQHVLARMSDVCGKLTNLEVPCIGAEAKPYFRDVHDRLVRLNTMTGGLVEVIRAVFEASNLPEQQRQGNYDAPACRLGGDTRRARGDRRRIQHELCEHGRAAGSLWISRRRSGDAGDLPGLVYSIQEIALVVRLT
jgi:magnesium transporter